MDKVEKVAYSIIAIVIAGGVWLVTDVSYPYVTHLHSTTITADAQWFVGETKPCVALFVPGQRFPQRISCDERRERVMDVEFKGLLFRAPTQTLNLLMDCKRMENHFFCTVVWEGEGRYRHAVSVH